MDIYLFYQKASKLRDDYLVQKHSHPQEFNRNQEMRLALLKDILTKTSAIKLSEGKSVFDEPISRIKLSKNYLRKLITQVFLDMGLNITRYTNEYGKTIVHFERISNSQ